VGLPVGFDDLAAAPVPEARPAAAEDRLYELLLTQKADGSFPLSPVLGEWLGSALAAVEEAAARYGEAVVATSLALALLERDEAKRRDEWRSAAEKARGWLSRQGSRFEAAEILGTAAVVGDRLRGPAYQETRAVGRRRELLGLPPALRT
jgi:hypothetical protein